MKLLMLFVLGIFLISFTSALEFDNLKSYNEDTDTITITNAFGLGEDLETATLKENTYDCSQYCSAEKDITLHSDGKLINDVRFYRIYEDGSRELSNIRSYQIKYYVEVPDYEPEKKIGYTENGSVYTYWNYNYVGSHYEWKNYNVGDEIKSGTYKVKLEGEKREGWSYDWQINIQGKWTEEWATWGNISAGANAEITLNFPADKNITAINTVTYNASVNVTNGATINNISLWTNSTGTWHRNQSITGLTNSSSENLTQSHGLASNNNAGDTQERGLRIAVNQNVTLEQVTKFGNTAASGISLHYLNGTNIVNGTLSGNNATFPSTQLIAGESYLICTILQTNSAWVDPASFEYSNTYVNFTSSLDCASGFANQTNVVREIEAIKVKVTSGASTNATTRTFSSVLPLGNTTWNVEACDTDNACGWNNASSPILNRTIFYSPPPSINLFAPANLTNTTNSTIRFNVSVTNTGGGISNVTLFVDGVANQTNTSGYNGTYIFLGVYSDATHNWSVQANASGGAGTTNGTRWFTIARSFIGAETYSPFTYETEEEIFSLNITTNGSIPSNQKFIYNTSTYSATLDSLGGNVWNLSALIQIPLNKTNHTFFFNYTLDSVVYSTTSRQQNVSETIFTEINSTYNNDFLNISFQDETSLTSINASVPAATFTYYLGNGTINKTYSYSNTSNNWNYTFGGYPTDRNLVVFPNFQYKQGSTYPQRIWEPSARTYNSTVYNQVLFLLNANDGIYVAIQTINLAGQTISGVDVNVTKTSDGTLIASGTTDGAGLVTFFLNPDIQQTIAISKSGYETQESTIFPTQSSYTFTLETSETSSTDYGQGIRVKLTPTNAILDQQAVYNFSYSINSTFWTLDSFGFYLYYGNDTLYNSNISTNSTGGTLYIRTVNVSNQTSMYVNYFYQANGNYSNFTRVWLVQSLQGRDYSIFHFFSDLTLYIDSSEGLYGIDDFGKFVISLAVIILCVGLVSARYGINNEAGVMVILFGLVFFLDYGLNFIPTIQITDNFSAPDNFLTIITFLMTLIILLKEERG